MVNRFPDIRAVPDRRKHPHIHTHTHTHTHTRTHTQIQQNLKILVNTSCKTVILRNCLR